MPTFHYQRTEMSDEVKKLEEKVTELQFKLDDQRADSIAMVSQLKLQVKELQAIVDVLRVHNIDLLTRMVNTIINCAPFQQY
jgi:hypothetical protein